MRLRSWLWPALMLIITAIVCSTAVRIEWYNHAVGGFLPRSEPGKWRTTSSDMAEMNFRRSLAYQRGSEMDEQALDNLKLSADEKAEIEQVRRRNQFNSRFRALVSTMGVYQYLLVPAGLFLSIGAARVKQTGLRSAGVACLAINLIAGGLMMYRGYYPALGW